MQAIFAWDCGSLVDNSHNSAEIISSIEPINQQIQLHAPKWPLEKINKVDLAILRCAIWELQIEAKTPPKVIIDEAIELAKGVAPEQVGRLKWAQRLMEIADPSLTDKGSPLTVAERDSLVELMTNGISRAVEATQTENAPVDLL